MSKPLLVDHPTDADDAEAAGGGGRRGVLHEAGEVGVEAVVHEVDGRVGRQRAERLGVGRGAGHGERSRPQLACKQAGRVERRLVDVLGVARERERQAAQAGRQPGHGRGAVGEVGVEVGDVADRIDPVGDGDRLEELLQVHLAQPPALASSHGLGGGHADDAGEAQRVPPGCAPERREEGAQVGAQPRQR
jgi:hypothetical protein